MFFVRPIRGSDLPALCQIAEESGVGFTSLPVNEDLLSRKISDSEASFNTQTNKPGSESYLFVMENSDTGEVVGTSGIESAVGLEDAFYHYHLGKAVHSSQKLNVHNVLDTLTLCNDYTGVSEICTLFLRENSRHSGNGRLLSKFRFLFMIEHAERFSDAVIAEMRGVSNENGDSPFWQWLREHFFSIDFPTADYLTGIGDKVFVAELMPKYPIYVSLLSKEAQSVIGKVHEKTQPALQLLEQEGFKCRGYVDIFDAGPTVEADLSQIKTAQNSLRLPVTIGQIDENAENCFIINTRIQDARAILADVQLSEDKRAIVSAETAQALNISEGENIRFALNKRG